MLVKFNLKHRKHPKSSDFNYTDELAVFLNSEYGFFQIFRNWVRKDINLKVEKAVREKFVDTKKINRFLRSKWQRFMLMEAHGILSDTAMKEGRISFIDTGFFYKSVFPYAHFSRADLQKFKRQQIRIV